MKKLLKKINILFCKHNWIYQYSSEYYQTSKVSTKYLIYWCDKCEKLKIKLDPTFKNK